MGLMKNIQNLFHDSRWVTVAQVEETVSIPDISNEGSPSPIEDGPHQPDSWTTSTEAFQAQANFSEKSSSAQSDDSPSVPASVPSTFSLLYESRDNRLCLFETRDGHLTAVDASRLV